MRRLFGEQTSEKSCACDAGRHTPNSIKVSEWISLCSRTRTNEVFEFLNTVDLATRFNLCFPVPSKRPDDVLSVLEMVWINGAGPMSHLISEGELCEFVEAHGIRQCFTASEGPWQNGLVERNGGIRKAAARKTIKDVGARSFVNWAKTPALSRLNFRQPKGSSVEKTNCQGHFWMRSKVANWHRWSCQITRLSLVDECHGCGLQDVPSKTMDTSHRVRGSSEFTHPGIVTGELVFVWRKVKKNRTDARTALVTYRCYGPAIVAGKERNNVFVSCRGRVTKVAPGCLRKGKRC